MIRGMIWKKKSQNQPYCRGTWVKHSNSIERISRKNEKGIRTDGTEGTGTLEYLNEIENAGTGFVLSVVILLKYFPCSFKAKKLETEP